MELGLGLVLVLLVSSANQQRGILPSPRHALPAPTTFAGRVLTPDGRPAAHVEVTTSAGGACLTAADGSFELVVDVPREAHEVEVVAVAQRGAAGVLRAAARVQPAALTPTTPVGILLLAPSLPGRARWLNEFEDPPGTDGVIRALVSFDDGRGPGLFVAGEFDRAGGMSAGGIARWNGAQWSPLDGGTNNEAYALAVFDDGSGPALYVGGSFGAAGGVPASNVAKWDGESWSPLGSGVNGAVNALAAFDDGSGPALYAGGVFTSAGGGAASRIAKWDGVAWQALGTGVDGTVNSLAVFDGGGGPALHVGGTFTTAGGVTVNRIARWDGASWATLASGVNAFVDALTVFDDGSGPALFAGGGFTNAGGSPALRAARWNGTSWAALGSGLDGLAHALTVFDDGTGPALYAGGDYASSNVKRWNGSSWTPLTSSSAAVLALCSFDAGNGPELYAGGHFRQLPGATVNHLMRWDGASWHGLGAGLVARAPNGGTLPGVLTGTTFDDGTGPALYVGGIFTFGDGLTTRNAARWDGTSWAAVGDWVGDGYSWCHVLCSFDDGTGPKLVAGCLFPSLAGLTVNHIAAWDGASWSALGSGMGGSSPTVKALAVFDDGSGPALYAAGRFTSAGGTPASHIAKWDGAGWTALGSGVNDGVSALLVFDDGSGAALHVAGAFTSAGGGSAPGIAKWDGSSWSGLGSGPISPAQALAVFDDGGGPALFSGGDHRVEKWDGATWSLVGSFSAGVEAHAVSDDGEGPARFAAGDITSVNGSAALRIAKWDGTSWSALGAGLDVGLLYGGTAESLTVYDDGIGPALIAGGSFQFSPSNDAFIAKWRHFGKVGRR